MILEKVFDWLILWHRRRWRYFDWLGEVVVWLRSDRRPNHQSPHAPLCAARATTPIKNSAQNTILITPTHAHQGTATSSIDPSYSRQCINPGSWHYVTVQHSVMRCFKVCWCWYVFATRPVQSTASSDRKLHTVCFSIGWKQVFFFLKRNECFVGPEVFLLCSVSGSSRIWCQSHHLHSLPSSDWFLVLEALQCLFHLEWSCVVFQLRATEGTAL